MSKAGNYWREVHGILVLDKPQGMTSNQALQKVRHLFRAAKAGHTGALDPLATGVLPLCFGEATKYSQLLLDADKAYQTRGRLGITTETADAEGEVLQRLPVPSLSAVELEQVLAQFRGDIEQLPPLYSALKVDGQPLYKLARAGKQVDMESKRRQVHIGELQLLEQGADYLDLQVSCSKGTYIRSLVADIGQALGCGAHVEALRRTQAGCFTLPQAWTLQQLQDLVEQDPSLAALEACLLPLETAVLHLDAVQLSAADAERLLQGQRLRIPDLTPQERVRLLGAQQRFLGLGEVLPGGVIQPRRLVRTS